MAELTEAKRDKEPKSDFGLPEERKYPMPDKSHARNAKARVIRDGVVLADGLAIESLRRFKDDVTEVRTDYEAGIGLGKFNDIQIGDEIETIEMKEKPRV
jgi:translation initiation factor IF-2